MSGKLFSSVFSLNVEEKESGQFFTFTLLFSKPRAQVFRFSFFTFLSYQNQKALRPGAGPCASNLSYSGGRDGEDCSSRTA
jgi:hypothetical protein